RRCPEGSGPQLGRSSQALRPVNPLITFPAPVSKYFHTYGLRCGSQPCLNLCCLKTDSEKETTRAGIEKAETCQSCK
ncbi:hypothetical protein, partial [Anaerotruncus colihominis]|uniref:hypothetical protein n=1 Tax=Anaerotruncus colihominis TaxID=169435 RepID=UPI00242FC996